jgi:hypothetical protein
MKNSNINNPMPNQTIGISKIVKAAKAQKQIKKTMQMADAMAMAKSMSMRPLSHNIIIKKK